MLVRFLTQSLKILSVLLLTVLVIAGSVSFFNYWTDREQAENIGRPVTITVTDDDDGSTVADKLADSDLIQYGFYFENRFRFAGTDLRPGTYTLRHGMSVADILEAITVPSEDEPETETEAIQPGESLQVTFIEGQRIEQFADALGEAGWEGDPAEFIALATNPVGVDNWSFLQSLPDGASLEGYLFPDTYDIASNASAQDVIDYLLGNFDAQFTADMRDSAADQGMTIHEVVTLASIVEREAAVEGERVTIAGLYRNRYDAGDWQLNADPTIQYIYGTEEEWWPAVSGTMVADSLDNPYNTYQIVGLPPGPIANPGVRALQAVLSPEEHDYFYMVAKEDGTDTHFFAVTEEEHIANLCGVHPDSPECGGGSYLPDDETLESAPDWVADRRELMAA